LIKKKLTFNNHFETILIS